MRKCCNKLKKPFFSVEKLKKPTQPHGKMTTVFTLGCKKKSISQIKKQISRSLMDKRKYFFSNEVSKMLLSVPVPKEGK